MYNSYEKHTKELYKSELVPFIAKEAYVNNQSNPWLHWHENIEFLRCKGGSGEVLSGGHKYAFESGDIICINSGSPHYLSAQSVKGMSYNYLIIDNLFLKNNGINAEHLSFSHHIHDPFACKLFDKALSAAMRDDDFDILKARTFTLDFLVYLCDRHLVSCDNSNITSIDEIKQVVNFVRNNFNRDITLQDAADIAGFSVCYFSRKFKKVTGQTFVTFLNTVRCENAANLLKKGAKIADVCYECGFNEPSYFSRTFKSIMGYSPSEAGRING